MAYLIRRKPTSSQAAIIELVKAAHTAGADPDQIKRFLSAGYAPMPEQWEFHALAREADREGETDRIALAGDRGGAKSHAIMGQVAIDDCQRFPGLDVLYLRKIGKAARKALDQLRSRTFISIPHSYNRQEGIIRFDNGSSMVVGHFKDDRDIDQYLGIEYDVIVIEEAPQLSESKVDKLLGSLRSSKPGWRPRAYFSGNPGGVGMQWFKQRFILPMRRGEKGRYRVVITSWRNNVFIDPGYKEDLLSLKGVLGRMWAQGDWDVGGGQFFTNWDYDRVVIPKMDVKGHWPLWASLDHGHTHPTAVYFHTYFDGKIYTVAEHIEARWLPARHTERIKEIARMFGRDAGRIPIAAGRDCFAAGGDSEGKTIAEQYSDLGLTLNPANVDRISGAAEMLNRLGDPYAEPPSPPTWFITESCVKLIECIPLMMSDPIGRKMS